MYTKYGVKIIHLALFLPTLMGICPIHLDVKCVKFYTTESSKRRLLYVTLLFIPMSAFFCGRTVQLVLWKGVINPHFHISYSYSTIMILETCVLIYMNWKQDDICLVLTRVVRHCINFKNKWMRNYNPMRSMIGFGLDTLIIFGTIFFAIVPFPGIAQYLLFPDTPVFLPTVLSPELVHNGWVYWSYAILHTFYAYVVAQNTWVVAVFGLLSTCSILPMIKCEFRIGANGQKARESLRTAWILPTEYRKVELNHYLAQEIGGYPLIVLQTVFGQFILFCTVSVIKYRSHIERPTRVLLTLWSSTIQVIWIIVLELASRIHEHSKKTLQSWKQMNFASKKERKYMSKFRRSSRPLNIGKQGLFTVKRLTVLKFMRAIIKGTFRALVLGGKDSR